MRYEELNTPSYIVQERKLRENLEILRRVREEAGCKILLAQKAFSMYRVYPLIAEYLDGTTASGIFEAKLAAEEFVRENGPGNLPVEEFVREKAPGALSVEKTVRWSENKAEEKGSLPASRKMPENHVFEPAYKNTEMRELCEICSHLYFNSLAQLEAHHSVWEPYQKAGKIKVALRINPEHSTQEGHAIYDPCAPGSRLGIRRSQMPEKLPEDVTGLHFHTLCEQGLEPLIETFRSVELRFASYLQEARFINLGGGHHITRPDYDVDGLISFVKEIKEKWQLEVYLEPGEAIALNAGTLITKVLDVIDTEDMPTLILDASAACHMPDVLEMPYTPPLFLAMKSGQEAYEEEQEQRVRKPEQADEKGPAARAAKTEAGKPTGASEGAWVRLASRTCLAGDVIGLYKLPAVPKVGDILTFGDMAIYSMVKNNTFNGMALPDIVLERDREADDRFELVKRFGYQDFKERLS